MWPWPWLRRLIGRGGHAAAVRSAPAPRIRARYDNAQSTDDNQRSWWMSDYLSAKSANSFQVRRQLRNRSRYEVSNNPYLFGICNGNADDLIGRGPTLQVTGRNAARNRQVESAWNEWAGAVDLVEKLRTCKLARTVDGEGFLVLKTVEDLESSVKLYPCDVEADQVTTPAPANLGELWVDGLVLHPVTGRPVAYHVLRHHPGDYYFPDLNPLKVDVIRARHVIHWFPRFRPGQVRGVPVFTAALDLFSELRSFRKAVLSKAQIAANLSAVLESDAPADADGTQTASPFDAVAIDRGMQVVLPHGMRMHQYEAPGDVTTYEMFSERCLAEACRPLAYPLNLALGTSQKFNFSSAKLDHINYRNVLEVERGDCEKVVLERIFAAWFDEAVMVPGLLPAGATLATTPHEWHWPGFPTLDAAADTQADIDQLNAGTLTWREFWAKRGYDWREVMGQQAIEKAELEKLGLSFGEPMKKTERVDEEAPATAQDGRRLRGAWDPDQPRDEDGRFGEGGTETDKAIDKHEEKVNGHITDLAHAEHLLDRHADEPPRSREDWEQSESKLRDADETVGQAARYLNAHEDELREALGGNDRAGELIEEARTSIEEAQESLASTITEAAHGAASFDGWSAQEAGEAAQEFAANFLRESILKVDGVQGAFHSLKERLNDHRDERREASHA